MRRIRHYGCMNIRLPDSGGGTSGRWETIRIAIRDWGPTVRLCLVLLVIDVPVVLGAVLYYLARRH